jgi:hypothetical protein
MERKEIIEAIYERRKHLYRDVRHLRMPQHIYRRIKELSSQLRAIPPKKQFRRGNHYKEMLYEFQLLKAKLACLASCDGELPLKTREVIYATDWDDQVSEKSVERDALLHRIQTQVLLHLVFSKYSDDKLRTLLY